MHSVPEPMTKVPFPEVRFSGRISSSESEKLPVGFRIRKVMRPRRAALLALILLCPSCGNGGGGGSGGGNPVFLRTPPPATAPTPVGTTHSNVPVDFTLVGPESNPVSIAVSVSTNGGGSYVPATPSYGNGSLSGLSSSPGGTIHTFLWNSVDDAVAVGATTPNTQV